MRDAAIIVGAITLVIAAVAIVVIAVRQMRRLVPKLDIETKQLDVTPSQNPIRVVGPLERPLVEIFTSDFEIGQRMEDIPLQPRVQAGLLNLLPRLSPVATSAAAELLSPTTYIMRFSPEISKGLAGGALSLMQSRTAEGVRAVAVGLDGKIAGNATLVSSATGIATATMAAWQIMAFVTAQKFLVDINQRLAQIETEVHSIKEWLDKDRFGKLLDDFAYLQRLTRELSAGDLTEGQVAVYAQQLEQIDRECLQIAAATRLQLESSKVQFASQQLKGGLISVEHSDTARKMVSDVEHLCKQDMLSRYTRCLAIRLIAALPINRRPLLTRIEELEQDHATARDWMNEFRKLAENRVSELKGTMTRESTDAEHQGKLKEHIAGTSERTFKLWSEVGELADRVRDEIRQEVTEESQPLSLAVTVNSSGEISKLQRTIAES